MNIVVAGGGPTGVEVSGTLAEMKKTVLPKDFPELDFSKLNIYLMEGSPKVLAAMSEISSSKSKEYLERLGVKVRLNARVKDFDGTHVHLEGGETIRANTLVWATGIKAASLEGMPAESIGKGGRLKVDAYNKVIGSSTIFALGDMAAMEGDQKFPQGHPQLAQPAIQQGKLLAKNIIRSLAQKQMEPFQYKDLGSMATIGRNLAVVDLPFWKFQGFFAWLVWMLVHLFSILGVKNKLFTFLNWCWNYFTYDQHLRLIIKPKKMG
jgi:NADH dehydrogenase